MDRIQTLNLPRCVAFGALGCTLLAELRTLQDEVLQMSKEKGIGC